MKFCIKCGNQLDDNARFCNNCGEPQENTASAQNETGYTPYAPQGQLSLSDFVEMYEPSSIKTVIKVFAVISFVLAGISIMSIFLVSIWALLDIAAYVALGYGILKKKNAICGLIFTLYYGLGSILVINSLPPATNILRMLLLAYFILATVYLFRVKADYNNFLRNQNMY